jgi:hypothetical protein
MRFKPVSQTETKGLPLWGGNLRTPGGFLLQSIGVLLILSEATGMIFTAQANESLAGTNNVGKLLMQVKAVVVTHYDVCNSGNG